MGDPLTVVSGPKGGSRKSKTELKIPECDLHFFSGSDIFVSCLPFIETVPEKIQDL